ncbi:hypothetical protein kam1_1669 [Methylacidiphilum kamchatkense Kam1]|nr:hypothetical protein kam1_1669 [Methylacidiphilum kamchatkense Kam1]
MKDRNTNTIEIYLKFLSLSAARAKNIKLIAKTTFDLVPLNIAIVRSVNKMISSRNFL